MNKVVKMQAKEVNMEALLRELKILVNGHNLTLKETLKGDELGSQRRHNCFFIRKEEHNIPWLYMMCDESAVDGDEALPSVTISFGDVVQISGQAIKIKSRGHEVILEVEERVGEK